MRARGNRDEYGPGNEDYEYDKWRQEQDDRMNFPDDDVLLARGKYATLSSERRVFLKELREDMEALAACAHRVMRSVELDNYRCSDVVAYAAQRIEAATARIEKIGLLSSEMEALKPEAWGKTKEIA